MSTPESNGNTWHMSTNSGGDEGNCVEVAWRKSSKSGGNEGNCVEVVAI